jgi:hypothetical protein
MITWMVVDFHLRTRLIVWTYAAIRPRASLFFGPGPTTAMTGRHRAVSGHHGPSSSEFATDGHLSRWTRFNQEPAALSLGARILEDTPRAAGGRGPYKES